MVNRTLDDGLVDNGDDSTEELPSFLFIIGTNYSPQELYLIFHFGTVHAVDQSLLLITPKLL